MVDRLAGQRPVHREHRIGAEHRLGRQFASIGSIGSVTSVLGVGTASSAASVMSAASCGSLLSAASLGSIMSAASKGGVMASDARSGDAVVRTAVQVVLIGGVVGLAVRTLLRTRSPN